MLDGDSLLDEGDGQTIRRRYFSIIEFFIFGYTITLFLVPLVFSWIISIDIWSFWIGIGMTIFEMIIYTFIFADMINYIASWRKASISYRNYSDKGVIKNFEENHAEFMDRLVSFLIIPLLILMFVIITLFKNYQNEDISLLCVLIFSIMYILTSTWYCFKIEKLVNQVLYNP